MSTINNIRTISELDDFPNETLNSSNVFFEVSKNNNGHIQTYKVSGQTLFAQLREYIMNIVGEQYVTLNTNQTITAEKIFTKPITHENNLCCIGKNAQPLLICNTPISGVALSAQWA